MRQSFSLCKTVPKLEILGEMQCENGAENESSMKVILLLVKRIASSDEIL